MSVLSRARRLVQHAGIDVQRHNPLRLPAGRLCSMLQRHDVDLVVDVGANDGGFVRDLREAGWDGRVLSFEPAAHAHERLQRAAMGDAAWRVATRQALGAAAGQATLQLAGNSASSSLLPMLATHVQAEPSSRTVGSEEVTVTTLDACAEASMAQSQRIFLKVDTQGYESQVLDGATATLRRCVGVQLELSLLALYEGQTLWRELCDRMLQAGFELHDLVPGFRDPGCGRLLQFDGVFFRAGMSPTAATTTLPR